MTRNVPVLVLGSLLAACGGEPVSSGGDPLPGEPVLAPLSTGTRWTYRVTDLLSGTFEKNVEVVGPATVPDSGAAAVLVKDTEPTQEERAWLEVKDGFLVRHREEDRAAGVLVRMTRWSPAAPKMLAAAAPAGWTKEITVSEREWHADGTEGVKDQTYAFRVVRQNVQIVVPAGTFTCLEVERVRVDKLEPPRIYWLAPGVGKVREEGERLEELVAFTPGS
jgi:hypothetical protein